MNKKFRYFLSSVMAAVGFYSFLGLPYESRYYGLLVGMVLVIFCFWFGLGIVFEGGVGTRLMSVILPVTFFGGFGLFVALLPLSFWLSLVFSILFGVIFYVLFLVENVFLVAIGFKTVPLYRAAYTVSLIVLLLTCFFVFNTLFSFRLNYVINTAAVWLVTALIFIYQFWAIAIELPDDGKNKNFWAYVLVPSGLISQMALIFSFWPVGIFKGSIYLVATIYVLSGLIQADIRDRLFKRTWMTFVWIGGAILLAMLLATPWR